MDKEIIDQLIEGNSIAIIGPSDSGKTYWVKNTLIPQLECLGKSTSYSIDGFNPPKADISIFDEVETFFDAKMLEEKYPKENPYYTESYIQKVQIWHVVYAEHLEPSVYIISRRNGDVDFLVNNFKTTDWDNRNIKSFEFPPK